MILRCISSLCIIIIFNSCQTDYDQIGNFPEIVNLILLDSLIIEESNGFLARPSSATLINDSLIAIESNYSKGVWVFNRFTGKELNSILNKSVMEKAFFIAGSDWTLYPTVYILDGITKSVYQFDLSQNTNQAEKYVNKITLKVPEGFRIMPETNTFFYNDGEFIVELASTTFKSSKDFYKNAEEFLGVFDSGGNLKFRFLNYPESLSELNGFLEPSFVYNSGLGNPDRLFLSFPSQKEIWVVDSLGKSSDLKKITFPESRYFDFELPLLEKEAGNNMGSTENKPATHYFGDIKMDEKNLYMQSYMKDNKNLDRFLLTSHIMRYDLETKTWSESQNPQNYINVGEFAGFLNDTLIFVDAGMINKNEKYIKRAILKPIKE